MSEKLFITRKRKKWKFAHFNEWSNCFQAKDVTAKTWPTYFPSDQPLTIEIGAGTADLSVELARRHPDRNFIAIDVKSDRLYKGAKVALQEELTNIAFVRAELRHLDQLLAANSVSELWITFPDPYARKKQAKHRLTHEAFLKQYAALLAEGGILRFKSDNRELFLWSLEQFVEEGWRFKELSFDLHESTLPEDYKITTYYERRFMGQGIEINYLSATHTS